MKCFLNIAFLFLSIVGYCADVNYGVAAIAPGLLKNANVVKRMEDVRFEIVNGRETILYRKYALTILNENGDAYADLYVAYNKMRKVISIDGSLYDAAGKQLKNVKNKDVKDISGVSDNNLMDDTRYKVHNFYCKAYPYTVEYEVVTKLNNSYSFPSWFPQSFEGQSVENSSFTVTAPKEYNVRYKAYNYKGEPTIATEKDKRRLTWKVHSLAAIKKQFASPVWQELTTAVLLAPSTFEMEGITGSAATWEELGKFQIILNEGRDKLPDNVLNDVKKLTLDKSDDREKVTTLYKYLQSNTRYISIQLGIGGLQPFEASFVAQKGYGDCKALSNYMYSLLKAAGIKSYYTWVSGGRDMDDKYINEDFPSDQFNHIILCVPLKKDTMWLECTSQTDPAGYMGSFTGNRKALLITETGGKLVSTPRYGLNENLQTRSVKGVVSETGDLTVTVKTRYKGLQQDNLQGMLNYLSKDKVKKVLNEQLNLSTYDITNFKYEENRSSMPQVDEQLDILISNYATISGKRLFIHPNLLNRSTQRITDEEERRYEYVIDFEYRDVDTVEIDIPEGYTVEAMPQDVSLKTKFGSYNSSIRIANDKLFYIRVREQYAGRFPAKDKEELFTFYEAIYKSDRSRVVLVKK